MGLDPQITYDVQEREKKQEEDKREKERAKFGKRGQNSVNADEISESREIKMGGTAYGIVVSLLSLYFSTRTLSFVRTRASTCIRLLTC